VRDLGLPAVFKLFINKSSAVAEMAVQCCASQIFTSECMAPLFNAFFLSDLSVYNHKSHNAKTSFFGLHFLLQTIWI